MACNASKDQCKLLFPTDSKLFTIHVCVMIAIVIIGCIIHYGILPNCPCSKDNKVIADRNAMNSNPRNVTGYIADSGSLKGAKMSGTRNFYLITEKI